MFKMNQSISQVELFENHHIQQKMSALTSSPSPSAGFVMTPREMRPSTAVDLNFESSNLHRKRQCTSRASSSSPFNKQSHSNSLSIWIPPFIEKESHNFLPPPMLLSSSPFPTEWSTEYCSDTSQESLLSTSSSSTSSTLSRTLSSRSNDSTSSSDSNNSFESGVTSCGKHAGSASFSPSTDNAFLSATCTPSRPVACRYGPAGHRQKQSTESLLGKDMEEEKGRASVTSMLSQDLIHWNLHSSREDPPSSPPPQKKERALFRPGRDHHGSRKGRQSASFINNGAHSGEERMAREDDCMRKSPQALLTTFQQPRQQHQGALHHRLPGGFRFSGDKCSLFSPATTATSSSSSSSSSGSSSGLFSPPPPLPTPEDAVPVPPAASTHPPPAAATAATAGKGRSLTRHATEPTALLTPLPQATPPQQHSTGQRTQQGGLRVPQASNLFSTPQGVKNRCLHTCGGGDDDWTQSEAALGFELDLFKQLLLNEKNENTKKKKKKKASPQISVELAMQRGLFGGSPSSAFAHNK